MDRDFVDLGLFLLLVVAILIFGDRPCNCFCDVSGSIDGVESNISYCPIDFYSNETLTITQYNMGKTVVSASNNGFWTYCVVNPDDYVFVECVEGCNKFCSIDDGSYSACQCFYNTSLDSDNNQQYWCQRHPKRLLV